jgi:hypothetical protein
MYYREQPPPE